MQALRSLPSCYVSSCLLNSDGGEGSLRTTLRQSNGSASTSRRLLETRGIASKMRESGSRVSAQLGPDTFSLTEKVLRLWNSQPDRKRTPSWVVSVASPPKDEVETKTNVSLNDDDGESFNWKNNWYPVIAEADLDKSVPYPFRILGRKVVFWHDKDGKWNCVLDVCPHRLAPLSEGRVDEQGCIQCSYHGWSFKGDGRCTNIPQARKEGPEAKACDQSRSRAVVLPVVVKQGILFVWPNEDSPDLASKTEAPITPGIDEKGWCAVATFRDLYYGYDTGMENLADPSHIPVAHHNVNGGILGKRSQAAPLDLEVKRMGPTGFEAEMRKAAGPSSIHTFDAPARFTYEFELRNIKGGRAATTTYCTPTAPGNCRIVVVNARNVMIGLSSGPNWWQFFPRWLDHQLMLNLLDGDMTLLHEQERYLREKTHGEIDKWNKAYFMPTTADRYVGAFRQWLTRFGGKGVQWADGVDPSLPPLITKREALLDRYTTHTKQCRVCSKAVQNFELARKVLFVIAAVFLGVGVALANSSQRIQAVILAALSGVIGLWLGGWIEMFYYKGYDHARIP